MATIKEIAKLAETSISSVSRVLNNSGYVSEPVRVRIQKVLDETGYRPNALAKALHSKRSQTIGVILPKINATSSGDNIAGIDHYFSSNGYTIILGNTNHSIKSELEFLDLFSEKQVDGIILVATTLTDEHVQKIKKVGKPVVVMGQLTNDGTPCVLFDEVKAAEEMVDYLIAEDHRSIALIGVPESDVSVGVMRKQGYLNSLMKHEVSASSNRVVEGNFSVESGYQACQELFEERQERPDAIFAVNDKMAIGAINYLLENGYRVPQDVSVCGVGGGNMSRYYNPKITSLVYDFEESGRVSAQLLHRLIEQPKLDLSNHVSFIPYHLEVRGSTAKK
ncbi:LacI family DNA-binding transcriptional regulator [Vibrio hangzhouensis]|uniref:Transcriptional regulator, LacI family n=1 Tax=Vibrio hangzhouensis TaxID=462991 RepID=A0A1H6BQG3_9VIBR|nr:LacI family DNA-binding transcriptional regulator [Vibrio hangzhouensis]SEG62900.1 transcriptional regulator, LacI family [Vibrio hangzhouensis]